MTPSERFDDDELLSIGIGNLWCCVRHWKQAEEHPQDLQLMGLDSHATLKVLPPEVRGGDGAGPTRQVGLPLCFICQWVSGGEG